MRSRIHEDQMYARSIEGFHFDAAGNSVLIFTCKSCQAEVEAVWKSVISVKTDLEYYKPDIFAVLDDRQFPWNVTFWNPDETSELVCFNALRCMFHMSLLRDVAPVEPNLFPVQTGHSDFYAFSQGDKAGILIPRQAVSVTVRSPNEYDVYVGTPHRVTFVSDLTSSFVEDLGLKLSSGDTPINATFFAIQHDELHARTFERGAGETGSCGSGALACHLVAELLELPHLRLTNCSTVRFRSSHMLQVGPDIGKSGYYVIGAMSQTAAFTIPLLEGS